MNSCLLGPFVTFASRGRGLGVIGAVEKRRMYDMSLAVDNAEPVDAAAPEDK